VTGPDSVPGVPLSHLEPELKAARAASFGEVASHYQRYRPGPPASAVDWLLPSPVARVIDLGAGTGALTRLLVDRADDVVAVEPDERMRTVLAEELPGINAVMGRGEAIPLPDSCADAVLASSSWHWMDLLPTLHEVGRILAPGGTLGVLWSGPDPEGPFIAGAQALLADQRHGGDVGTSTDDDADTPMDDVAGFILEDARRPVSSLEIPSGTGFEQPDHATFAWEVPLNADELIGLLGTTSWIITMPEERRTRVVSEARRLLRDLMGIDGETTVDVAFRSDVWRSRWTG